MRVSVYIPSYNNARYLSDCLDSILTQTYQDFEIIIADDGSTDGSIELLMQYQSRYPEKIHLVCHPGNGHKGFAATCNLALQQTKGEYIARNDSDDIWLPDKLEQQISFLDDHNQIDLVYSYASYIDSSGLEKRGLCGLDVTLSENPLQVILISQCIPETTVIFRRSVLNRIGFYDESIFYSDWDLMIRIFSHCSAGFIDRPLAKYRMHSSNMSKGIDPKINLERILTLFHRLEDKSFTIGGAVLAPRNLALLDLQIAFHEFCMGNMEEAVTFLHRAFLKDPNLSYDITFVNSWLRTWKPDFYTYQHQHFGFWTLSHLPSNINPDLKRELFELLLNQPETKAFFLQRGIKNGQDQPVPIELVHIFDDCPDELKLPQLWKLDILKEVFSSLLFDSFKNGNVRKIRFYWWRTVICNPALLINRGIWSIAIKVFLNPKVFS